MRIFVRTLAGRRFDLDLESDDTVDSLKRRIFEDIGIPTDRQQLMFAGQRIDPALTLSAHDVMDGSTLVVVRQSHCSANIQTVPTLQANAPIQSDREKVRRQLLLQIRGELLTEVEAVVASARIENQQSDDAYVAPIGTPVSVWLLMMQYLVTKARAAMEARTHRVAVEAVQQLERLNPNDLLETIDWQTQEPTYTNECRMWRATLLFCEGTSGSRAMTLMGSESQALSGGDLIFRPNRHVCGPLTAGAEVATVSQTRSVLPGQVRRASTRRGFEKRCRKETNAC